VGLKWILTLVVGTHHVLTFGRRHPSYRPAKSRKHPLRERVLSAWGWIGGAHTDSSRLARSQSTEPTLARLVRRCSIHVATLFEGPCGARTDLGKLRLVIRLCDVSKRLWLEHHDFPALEQYPLYVGPGTQLFRRLDARSSSPAFCRRSSDCGGYQHSSHFAEPCDAF
jgi:hypothetical protein